ncbi:hypothetical protein H6F61_10280 [Cyanobacteria bacterium FACHB-472]|nr:hypothetical protein [Cyanobacteria bacterium FACHB-472]
MVKKIALFCLSLILVVVIMPPLTLAQGTSYLESRISRLEAENYQMRSLITQLDAQVDALQQSGASRPPSVPSRVTRTRPSSDPMFDRLATLVVELKQRINKLEKLVTELQKKRS